MRPPSISIPTEPERSQTVLIVDDEAGVIEAVREGVRGLSCNVIATTDPRAALRILRGNQPIALLITDLFMPGMDGGRLLREGRKARPTLRAVLLSGIASEEEIVKWRRRGEWIVAKPWLENELATAVKTVLADTRDRGNGTHANG